MSLTPSSAEYSTWLIATATIGGLGFAACVTGSINAAVATNVYGKDVEELTDEFNGGEEAKLGDRVWDYAICGTIRSASGWFAYGAFAFGVTFGLSISLQLALSDASVRDALTHDDRLYKLIQGGSYTATGFAAVGMAFFAFGMMYFHHFMGWFLLFFTLVVPSSILGIIYYLRDHPSEL